MSGRRPTILVADDEAALRGLVRATLDDSYELLEAGDGRAALEIADRHRVDLVLLDWIMAGMAGIEVARGLRHNPKTASIPIIMLTARGSREDLAAGEEAGVFAYLVKPFSPLELIERVEEALANSRSGGQK
ncbi:MAG: response regulator [Phycisphaeraceae bacterium]